MYFKDAKAGLNKMKDILYSWTKMTQNLNGLNIYLQCQFYIDPYFSPN